MPVDCGEVLAIWYAAALPSCGVPDGGGLRGGEDWEEMLGGGVPKAMFQ